MKKIMDIWETFEIESTDHLNKTFGSYATFDLQGGSNSKVSDIKVTTQKGNHFYIEAKHCPAQCGQFVLLPNIATKQFDYSPLNAVKINRYSQAIIDHMNSNFEKYKEAGTSGQEIIMKNGPDIFAAWIIQTYQNKGARFIITNNNIIIRIEDFSKYFYVTAKYRVKRSGSDSVGKRRVCAVSTYIKNNYPITSLTQDDKKLFITSKQYLHNSRFIIDGTEYMISKRDGNYEIRRLSNTFNANVIFSISAKENISGLSNQEFRSILIE